MLSGVLGPCLFLIYINDIYLNIPGKLLKLADDTKVVCPIENEDYGEMYRRSRQIDELVK